MRGIGLASAAGLAGAAAIVVFGGVLAFTAGLLVIAGVTGWVIVAGLRVGSGGHIDRGWRVVAAIAIAAIAVAVGQIGMWLYAMTEGGVLSLVDYLAQTFGVLVPAQFIIAIGVAWWSARPSGLGTR